MTFLREECLRDPASAQLFTLLPPSPRLAATHPAADSDKLLELVRQWEPDSRWVKAGKKLIEFGEKLTPNQLVTLGKLGRDIMERFSEPELGQQFAEALAREARAGEPRAEPPRTEIFVHAASRLGERAQAVSNAVAGSVHVPVDTGSSISKCGDKSRQPLRSRQSSLEPTPNN
jgi:hypothetical protein